MPLYFDSSAVVKYYVSEPGSTWVRGQIDSGDLIVLSEITVVEVAAALGMLNRARRINSRLRQSFWHRFEHDCVQRYDLTPISRRVVYSAASLCTNHPLRAYDALQLAGCLALEIPLAAEGAGLVFVSADDALVTAARNEGLGVENPFWHRDRDPGSSA